MLSVGLALYRACLSVRRRLQAFNTNHHFRTAVQCLLMRGISQNPWGKRTIGITHLGHTPGKLRSIQSIEPTVGVGQGSAETLASRKQDRSLKRAQLITTMANAKQKTATMPDVIPVTMLSGFLGAGTFDQYLKAVTRPFHALSFINSARLCRQNHSVATTLGEYQAQNGLYCERRCQRQRGCKADQERPDARQSFCHQHHDRSC